MGDTGSNDAHGIYRCDSDGTSPSTVMGSSSSRLGTSSSSDGNTLWNDTVWSAPASDDDGWSSSGYDGATSSGSASPEIGAYPSYG